MCRVVSIGLFVLLLWHVLACGIASVGMWWQEESDLSKRLLMYRSVDSVVEFYVPLPDSAEKTLLTRTTPHGFGYHGHYYSVISLELENDTLYIAGLEATNPSFWQDDLLTFLNRHLTLPEPNRKASQLLKLLLKEYSPGSRIRLSFLSPYWQEHVLIPDLTLRYSTRSEPTHSPPPERVI